MSSMSGSMGMQSGMGRTGNKIPSGYKGGQIQNFTPEMMDLFKHLMGQLGPNSYQSKLAAGDEETYNQMEAPALKQFAGLQGGLASRFSGMGMGARKSSGFKNSANQAASDFAGQLQANRVNLRQNAIKDLQGYGNSLLQQKPYDQFLVQKPQSQWGQIAGAALQGAGTALGGYLGRPQNDQGE